MKNQHGTGCSSAWWRWFSSAPVATDRWSRAKDRLGGLYDAAGYMVHQIEKYAEDRFLLFHQPSHRRGSGGPYPTGDDGDQLPPLSGDFLDQFRLNLDQAAIIIHERRRTER